MAMRDPQQQYEREAGTPTGLSPDPLLHEGRSSKLWIGAIFAAVVIAIIITFVAIGGGDRHAANQQAGNGPPVTTGSGNKAPQSALPGGRGSSRGQSTGQ